ncbi:asparagine synthase-related protein [Paenibacillus crassostreae]|uniref:asparagine synthase (glutamine-hydrolyzing) n=1 Tax=Paenibacillus crassostreae TaxID=1763538 RepID=A0A167GD43_9BACL|nr:asparagine synthase-related protein [Paenibacillus crassostreae]AOZ92688.1 asparagine synthetase B [Paenibacillus crassostreae]OAB77459.1 asparagine synthetase B [Paenibacillus crassostreae]
MSAIAGIYRFNGEDAQIEHGGFMMEALKQYPANQSALWHKEQVLLGCHAQWITEQSIHETLPYYDHHRELAITADAIIDNRDELMDQLQVLHNVRKSMTDSEILLLAYEQWGESMPARLVGDFAFVIWDERKKQFFGARDFSGARTLYYHRNEQQLSFCTVIHPLLSLPYIHKELNEPWLAEFLAISGVFEPPDLSTTIYKHIEQLPPSHTISIKNNKVVITRYNALSDVAPLQLTSSLDYEEAFRNVFNIAVTSRIQRTNRNVGAHLSGGLDSGAVVSFAARALQNNNRPLHTFSYVPEDGFVDWTSKYRLADERPLIKQTVQYVGNIDDNYMDFKGRSSLSEVDDWLDIMESPYKFFDNTFWLRGIYEEAQQRGIDIMLNGARGNYSISWGPAIEYYTKLMKKFEWLRLSREIKLFSKNVGVGRKRVYSIVGRKAYPILERVRPSSSPYDYPQLINSDYAKLAGVYDKLGDTNFTGIGSTQDLPADPLEARRQHYDRVNMWSTTGTSSCKLSLRYSVWSHDPTNDLRVIRFCLSTPMEQFVQNGVDRSLVRRATKGWLPDPIRLNQRTRGIQAADSIHRMSDEWPVFIEELEHLSRDSRMQQIINMPVFHNALTEARNGLHPNQAYDPTIKLLMRSLIVYRFLQKNF